jgi:hypothetical protein
MSQDRIDELIQDLKGLQVREQIILTALEQAYHDRTNKTTTQTHTTTRQNSPNRASVPDIVSAARATDPIPSFKKGDRVVIINKVRPPRDRQINSGDRTAVVSNVYKGRIEIKTTNGTYTWRAPKNLRRRQW